MLLAVRDAEAEHEDATSILHNAEIELEASRQAGDGPDFTVLECQLKIARLRKSLASSRQDRATRLQQQLRRQQFLVSRMVATTDAASAAGVTVKQLKMVLMTQQADLDGARAGQKHRNEIIQLEQAVVETTTMLDVGKERMAYSESISHGFEAVLTRNPVGSLYLFSVAPWIS